MVNIEPLFSLHLQLWTSSRRGNEPFTVCCLAFGIDRPLCRLKFCLNCGKRRRYMFVVVIPMTFYNNIKPKLLVNSNPITLLIVFTGCGWPNESINWDDCFVRRTTNATRRRAINYGVEASLRVSFQLSDKSDCCCLHSNGFTSLETETGKLEKKLKWKLFRKSSNGKLFTTFLHQKFGQRVDTDLSENFRSNGNCLDSIKVTIHSLNMQFVILPFVEAIVKDFAGFYWSAFSGKRTE